MQHLRRPAAVGRPALVAGREAEGWRTAAVTVHPEGGGPAGGVVEVPLAALLAAEGMEAVADAKVALAMLAAMAKKQHPTQTQ